MDDAFLKYYEHELDALRRSSQLFAAEFPKVARRLQLGEQECADPYVERLLEGVAFLTARIARKVDAAQSEFPETLLNRLAPEYNAPVASRAILCIQPADTEDVLPKGTVFTAATSLPDKPLCAYTLREDFTPSGVRVIESRYDDAEVLEAAARAGMQAVGALKLVVDCPRTPANDLCFYMALPERAAGELLGLLMSDGAGVLVQANDESPAPATACRLEELPPPGGALALPPVAEYFLLPEQFSFFRLCNAGPYLPTAGKATISLLLKRPPSDRLRILLQAGNALKTDCACAINVQERRLDRMAPSWQPSEHVVPDLTANGNLEVLQVLSLAAYDSDNVKLFDAYPIYHAEDGLMPEGRERLNYFTTHRDTAVASSRQRVSPYAGSEVYLRISGPDYTEKRDAVSSLACRALCSNRDLPLFLRQDATLSCGSSEATASFAAPPGHPYGPPAQDSARWMCLALARMSPSVLASYGDQALAAMLRELLHHLHRPDDMVAMRQADSIQSACVRAKSRTLPILGDLCVVRGWSFDIELNERAFGGSSVYLFARSLAAFILEHTELNTFTEVTIRTSTGPLHTWQQQANIP